MFTGIVEETGAVVGVDRRGEDTVLSVYGPTVLVGASVGGCIAVDGVCLTTDHVDRAGGVFTALVTAETADRTSLGWRQPGDVVNLERAATPGTRLDGHVLVGQVDGVGRVLARAEGRSPALRVGLPGGLARYAAPHGWIALDGVSVSVRSLGDTWVTVGLAAARLRATTLGARRVGDAVNVEVDVLAKYVERALSGGMPR